MYIQKSKTINSGEFSCTKEIIPEFSGYDCTTVDDINCSITQWMLEVANHFVEFSRDRKSSDQVGSQKNFYR
jgi:hypothetical protein